MNDKKLPMGEEFSGGIPIEKIYTMPAGRPPSSPVTQFPLQRTPDRLFVLLDDVEVEHKLDPAWLAANGLSIDYSKIELRLLSLDEKKSTMQTAKSFIRKIKGRPKECSFALRDGNGNEVATVDFTEEWNVEKT